MLITIVPMEKHTSMQYVCIDAHTSMHSLMCCKRGESWKVIGHTSMVGSRMLFE